MDLPQSQILTISENQRETKEEFANIVNKLGNKILLEDAINQSISNEWFRSKKQNSIVQKSGYKDSSYHMANALTAYPSDNWTKEDIETATNITLNNISYSSILEYYQSDDYYNNIVDY